MYRITKSMNVKVDYLKFSQSGASIQEIKNNPKVWIVNWLIDSNQGIRFIPISSCAKFLDELKIVSFISLI